MDIQTRTGKRRIQLDTFDVVSVIFLSLFAILIFYPFYNALLTSLVTSKQYTLHPAMLFPVNVTFDNYLQVLQNPFIFTGYRNTLIVVIVGVCYSLSMTAAMAYAFSRKFPGKKLLFSLVLFTMYFGGGLIPLYLLVKSLGLMDHLSALLLVNGVSPFYMIIMKAGFEQIPDSLEESAKIDGANEITIFFKVMLPLQKALLATFALFIAVDRWNDWFLPMLFIKSGNNFTLQVVLRGIVFEAMADNTQNASSLTKSFFSQGIQIAAVVMTMLPIMMFYPFLQKYFVKGMMLGAVKM